MKANVNGIEVEGTPAEVAALIREMNLPAGTAIPYSGGMKETMDFVKIPSRYEVLIEQNPLIKIYNDQGVQIHPTSDIGKPHRFHKCDKMPDMANNSYTFSYDARVGEHVGCCNYCKLPVLVGGETDAQRPDNRST